VSETLDPAVSYLTMVVDAEDEKILEQITKQLNKLIDVIKITDFTKKEHVERELILAKVTCPAKEKNKLESALNKYTVRIIQHKADIAILEAVGEQQQIKQLLEALEPWGVEELARTGRIAIGVD
jgi:acetolactate synthase-1/3 small subunit